MDFQAKCSKDARVWFNENWQRDKTTTYLDFENHYNKKLGKCFIFVQWNYNDDAGPSWYSDSLLANIYENAKVANFHVYHEYNRDPGVASSDRMVSCHINGVNCKSSDEFEKTMRPYMSD